MDNNITVNVGVRVRPLLTKEDKNVIKYIHGEGAPPVLMVSDKRNIYAFDNIFSSEVHQCEVYNVTVKPLVSKVLDGYNCTILAYGQTGTGKTYTMGTDSKRFHDTDSGLIPRVLDDFFDVSIRDPDMTISISFIEIYNEKVYDLLSGSKAPLVVKGFCVNGMTCVGVERNEDARHWLLVGGKGRHVRHTALNASSSRSHAIFTVYCTRTDTDITSKLHLVDLAGSESVRRTGNQGQAFHEGVTINKGLLAVGRVISALSDKSVVPYRDSTLTTILHDSLSINNYVSLLACISPSETDISETLATLRFADKAKCIKNRPQLENIVKEYDKANPGILGNIEPLTTIKKKRKLPSLFSTSTQIKKPLFGNRNASIQSVSTRSDRFTSSPNFASTLDSLSISTSTTIEPKSYNLSPLVRQCTALVQNSIIEHVNNVIDQKFAATPGLFLKQNDKENASPPLIMEWSTIKSQATELIRKELAQLTGKNTLNKNSRNSPLSRRHLIFDSPVASELEKDSEATITEPDDQLFKVPVPIHPIVNRLKKSERQSVSVATSPIKVRRSMRLSMMAPDDTMVPTPAPRFKVAGNVNRLINTTTCNMYSPFKPTRRSVRLSMKCITAPFLQIPATPKPVTVAEEDTSLDDFVPVPAPRSIKVKQKSRGRKPKSPPKPKTPKSNSPHKNHRLKILHILNFGSQKEVQCLATVGVKTALQIITYRTLNGRFKTYDDLKKIPMWGINKFNKFMLANQLN